MRIADGFRRLIAEWNLTSRFYDGKLQMRNNVKGFLAYVEIDMNKSNEPITGLIRNGFQIPIDVVFISKHPVTPAYSCTFGWPVIIISRIDISSYDI